MTDLEQRLVDSLADVGGGAPHPGDLATGARSRLRRRRRTTAAAVAAVLVVVAVPVGASLLSGHAPDVAEKPERWRTESYRDMTLSVPSDWGYSSGSDWCDKGVSLAEAEPRVTRPGSADDTLCGPTYGYGIVFAPAGFDFERGFVTFPQGAHEATIETAQASVHISTQSEEQLHQIRTSVERITDADPNGCPIPTTRVFGHTNPASVCRYDTDGNLLEQSERLSDDQTDALRRALAAAPEQARGRACGGVGSEYVLVLIDGRKVQVFYDARCSAANVAIINNRRVELTEDVLYWVLSPGWSGSVGRGVPLPDELRTLD